MMQRHIAGQLQHVKPCSTGHLQWVSQLCMHAPRLPTLHVQQQRRHQLIVIRSTPDTEEARSPLDAPQVSPNCRIDRPADHMYAVTCQQWSASTEQFVRFICIAGMGSTPAQQTS